MTGRTDTLVQTLFNKPSLQECSLQQVDYLAHQYPYFSAAQLLLLQKIEGDADAHGALLQRAALHVGHPLQLHYWLSPTAFETELPKAELFQKPIPANAPKKEHELPTELAEPATGIKPPTAIETPAYQDTEGITNEPVESELPNPEPIAVEETRALPAEVPAGAAPVQVAENTPQPDAPAPLLFEPYHTVDYFASQGIRLSQQEAANDALGKQLKSFTEWLKTMKRLPEATAVPSGDAISEKKVEHLAAHSLDTPEVVTESMAEVWLKQGNVQKATEVYNKLSLRNPSKSAYFAAKIESLKKS